MPDDLKRNRAESKGRNFQLVGIKNSDGFTKGIRHRSDSKGSIDKILSGCAADGLDMIGKITCSFDCTLFKIPCRVLFLPGKLKLLQHPSVEVCCQD